MQNMSWNLDLVHFILIALLFLFSLLSVFFYLSKKQARQFAQQLQLQLQQTEQQREASESNSKQWQLRSIELESTQQEKDKAFQQQLAQLQQAKEQLRQVFENTAQRIFEEKNKQFQSQHQQSMQQVLTPLKEQLQQFQQRINDVHDKSTKSNADLHAELQKVMNIGLAMNQEATNLTKALKGQSQQRGAWGEAQLERTLEMSGLLKGSHYTSQMPLENKQGERRRPDFVVLLPDNKHIVIDSKVTLVAYERAITAEHEAERMQAFDEHIKSVKAHIDDLKSKDYTQLIGLRTPSFVLMFMPIEPAYIEALKHDPRLFEYGYHKGVVLVSHTTLIPILRTVANLWTMAEANQQADDLIQHASAIYQQVRVVAERLHRLGKNLDTVNKQYNSTVVGLTGQQGLYRKVERFSRLSTDSMTELPVLDDRSYELNTNDIELKILEDTSELDAKPST